jgi:hypothetical protein
MLSPNGLKIRRPGLSPIVGKSRAFGGQSQARPCIPFLIFWTQAGALAQGCTDDDDREVNIVSTLPGEMT